MHLVSSAIRRGTALLSIGCAAVIVSACAANMGAAPNAAPMASADKGVFFENLKDGDVVSSPFVVKFGIKGMAVEPAMPNGSLKPNSGHHHLLINQDAIPAGNALQFADQVLHFGKGQTETELKLPPGQYKLTLQFANAAHVSYGLAMSKTVQITVK